MVLFVHNLHISIAFEWFYLVRCANTKICIFIVIQKCSSSVWIEYEFLNCYTLRSLFTCSFIYAPKHSSSISLTHSLFFSISLSHLSPAFQYLYSKNELKRFSVFFPSHFSYVPLQRGKGLCAMYMAHGIFVLSLNSELEYKSFL